MARAKTNLCSCDSPTTDITIHTPHCESRPQTLCSKRCQSHLHRSQRATQSQTATATQATIHCESTTALGWQCLEIRLALAHWYRRSSKALHYPWHLSQTSAFLAWRQVGVNSTLQHEDTALQGGLVSECRVQATQMCKECLRGSLREVRWGRLYDCVCHATSDFHSSATR